MLSDDEVIGAVRLALRQLYDTAALRANPLTGALGLAGLPNAASELRRILTEAIHSLRPGRDVPADAGAWRAHDILVYRFLQQTGQSEVAKQLGLSIRHLRREEVRAAEVLAQALSVRLGRTITLPPAGEARVPESLGEDDTVSDELAWLDDLESAQEVDLRDVLSGAVRVSRPLAQERGLEVQGHFPEEPLRVTTQCVALREIILELLTVAFCHAAEASVTVAARAGGDRAVVEIGALRAGRVPTSHATCDAAIAMAHQLASRCGIAISTEVTEADFRAEIAIALARQVPILVIDDNEDTLHLLQRYVSGTRFRLLGATSLMEALDIAARTAPDMIVLDVMMPRVDGWEILSELRQHPLTAAAPVVVCSILTQEELALSLGASGYVRKPVSRQVFLQALERYLPRHSSTHLAAPESP